MNKSSVQRFQRGFTLLELIVVIAILGFLITMVTANFTTSLKRGRDLKHKGEMSALKTALQLYFSDYSSYPADSGSTTNYKINGCGASGTSTCPLGTCSSVDFGAGNDTCTAAVYMTKFPVEYGVGGSTGLKYHQTNSGATFCMHIPLELSADGDIAKSKARCTSPCTGVTLGTSDYVVCSE
jgi:prepilin-type N-terminal cleavage/methylation domain-containing protein